MLIETITGEKNTLFSIILLLILAYGLFRLKNTRCICQSHFFNIAGTYIPNFQTVLCAHPNDIKIYITNYNKYILNIYNMFLKCLVIL